MLDRADAGGREGDLARMRLGVSDELCERVDRQALADHDHVRRLHRERDGLEALDGVPAEVGKQRGVGDVRARVGEQQSRSEEHTSELQSLMRISYAVFCLKKKKQKNKQ